MQDWYRDGIPVWWDESDRVNFEAVARVSKSRAAIERAQEKASKAKTAVHGRYFVAEPVVLGGGDFPTRDEWLEEQSKKKNNKPVSTKFGSTVDKNKYMKGRK
jgi:hypothetical protein